jgi:hypothetical protein
VTTGFSGGDTVHFEREGNGAGQKVEAPVQVTEQVKEGDTVHLNRGEMEQVKNWEFQFR